MDLWHFIRILHKKLKVFMAVFAVLLLAVSVGVLFIKPVYQATSKLIGMDEGYIGLGDPGIKLSLTRSQLLDAQIKMIKDNAVINESIKELDIRDDKGVLVPARELLSRLFVQPLEDTDIIKIKAESTSAAEAAKIANSVARQFVKWTQKVSRLQKESLRKYLDDSMKLVRYRQFILSKRTSALKKKGAYAPVGDDLQQEIRRQVELEVEKAKINIILKEEQLKLFLTENDELASALKDRSDVLERGISNFRRSLSGMSSAEAENADIQREEKVLNSLYSMFFQKMNDLKISEAVRQGGARIVSYAGTASAPARNKKIFIFFAGAALALIMSVAAVLLTEYADHTVKTGDEAAHALGLRLISEPHFTISEKPEEWAKAEAPKELLLYIDSVLGPENKSVIFAGPAGDISKAFFAVSAAAMSSKENKKTLLLDADTLLPAVDKVFSCSNTPGFGDVVGSQAAFQQAVLGTGSGGLFVMPAGGRPPQEETLFDQERIKDLMAKLEESFDRIIIIGPPPSERGAARQLYRFSSTAIFAMSQGLSTRESAREAAGIAKAAGAKLGAVVFSHLTFSRA